MARRVLTKQQKFDLEMKWKPKFYGTNVSFIIKNEKTNIKLVNSMLYYAIRYMSRDEFFEFLNTFESVIDWEYVVCYINSCVYNYGRQTTNNILNKILTLYGHHFTPEQWTKISETVAKSDKLIRKFKDKLDWKVISKYKEFTPEFLVEMIDYVKLDIIFNNSYVNKLEKQIITYTKDHLIEVMTYKPIKENKDEVS